MFEAFMNTKVVPRILQELPQQFESMPDIVMLQNATDLTMFNAIGAYIVHPRPAHRVMQLLAFKLLTSRFTMLRMPNNRQPPA
jgi:hypothetical protein